MILVTNNKTIFVLKTASSSNSLVFIKVLMKEFDKVKLCLDFKLSPCFECHILSFG